MRLAVAVLVLALAGVAGLAWLVLRHSPAPATTTDVTLGPRARPQGDLWRSGVPPIPSLNVFTTRDAVAVRLVLAYTHETLVDRDPWTGELRAGAARAWRVDDDGRTWIFDLRDDLRFADGAPVTREDVEFTLRAARDPRVEPKSDMSAALASLESAVLRGERELVLVAKEPDGQLPLRIAAEVRIAQIAFFSAEIRSRAEDATPWDDAWTQALAEAAWSGPGTGPYAVRRRDDGSPDWSRGEYLDLVANAHGWQRSARATSWNLAGFRLLFLPDESARLAALKRGEIDWFTSTSGEDLAALRAGDPLLARAYRVFAYDPPHMGHLQVVWNCRRPALDKASVRRALGLLFDRATICREVFGGAAAITRGWFKPGMPEYPAAEEAPRFSIAEAKALLAAEGFGPNRVPLRVEVLCASEAQMLRRTAELALASFREAGVELVPVPGDWASVYARLTSHDFDGVLMLQYHDPVIDPHDVFARDDNDMGWRNDQAESLLLAAQREPERAARAKLYLEFQDLLAAEQPVTLLVHPLTQVLVHARFQDAEPGPLGLSPERFWVAPEERIAGAAPK
ncbi:MAG: ABC transporter substrate-binding protein [Planctomycetes bacterium]|nr:ABC transporter substrate-binding protein [Planctomycetota bacterium]